MGANAWIVGLAIRLQSWISQLFGASRIRVTAGLSDRSIGQRAVELQPKAGGDNIYKPGIEYLRTLDVPTQFGWSPSRCEAVADRGYCKFEDIAACEAAGITAYVPKPIRGFAARATRLQRTCRASSAVANGAERPVITIYLARYAQESAFRDGHRRQDNGTQVANVARLALAARPSVDFYGYWQR